MQGRKQTGLVSLGREPLEVSIHKKGSEPSADTSRQGMEGGWWRKIGEPKRGLRDAALTPR